MLNVISGVHGAPTPPVTNSYESIATVTVGAGGASSIAFSSIPATYKHLQIRGIFRSTTAGGSDNVAFRLNSDSGTNYATHAVIGNGSAASAAAFTGNNYGYLPSASPDSVDTSGIFGAAVIDILDYANTSKNTTVRALNGYDDNGSGGYRRVQLSSNLWLNTAAVNDVTFYNSGNFAQYSSFALYGIKG